MPALAGLIVLVSYKLSVNTTMIYNTSTETTVLNVLHSIAYEIHHGNNLDELDLADVKSAIEMLTDAPWNDERTWRKMPKTIPTPLVHVIDEDSFDPRDRWAVYINSLCMGIHGDKQNALNQAESIKRALGITQ